MKCLKCNSIIPDDSMFCTSCGAKVEQAQEEIVREEEANQRACPSCAAIVAGDARFCNNCGVNLVKGFQKSDRQAKKTNPLRALSKKKAVIIATAAVLLVAIVLTVCGLTNWFGAGGPAFQIASATKKTLLSDSFTAEFQFSQDYKGEQISETQQAEGTIYASIDVKNRDVKVYAELIVGGESGVIAIYDGYYIMDSRNGCYGEDISEALESYFDAYEEGNNKSFSWKRFLDSVYGAGTYYEAKEDIDFDALNTCVANYLECLNDPEWLEENAGYQKEKTDDMTEYRFDPNIYSFLKESVQEFKPAIINEEDYEQIYDEISELRFPSKYTDVSVAFGVKSGRLVQVTLDVTGTEDSLTSGVNTHANVTLYDIGKTQINEKELEDLLYAAKRNQ